MSGRVPFFCASSCENDTKCAGPWGDLELAWGSAPGTHHRRAGRNNQDALAVRRRPEALVAVVCDGCGSGAHSEVGARLGARIVADELLRLGGAPDAVGLATLRRLRSIASAAGGDERFVSEHLLFTIVAAHVTPARTRVLALGDGLAYVDGARLDLGPCHGNAPAYLGYALLEGHPRAAESRLRLLCDLPTPEVTTLMLATDGAERLAASLDLTAWVDADALFSNRDALRRRLELLGRDVVRRGEGGSLRKQGGVLHDDTTVVLIRRSRTPARRFPPTEGEAGRRPDGGDVDAATAAARGRDVGEDLSDEQPGPRGEIVPSIRHAHGAAASPSSGGSASRVRDEEDHS